MTKNHSLIVGASIVLSCLILSLSFGHPAVGQSAVSPPVAGNYQLVVTEAQGSTTLFVFARATGQCWSKSTNPGIPGWRDLGSPVVNGGK